MVTHFATLTGFRYAKKKMKLSYYIALALACLLVASTVDCVNSFSTANKKSVKKGVSSKKRAAKRKSRTNAKKQVQETSTKTNSVNEDHVCADGDHTCQANGDQKIEAERGAPKNGRTTDFQIQHSVSPFSPFVNRGSIDVEISKLSKKIITRVKSRDELSVEETQNIVEQALNGGFYRIRMQAKAGDDEAGYVTASIPACALVIGGFREQLYLHLDFDGNLLGIEYRTPLTKAYTCNAKQLRRKLSKLDDDTIKLSTSATSAMPRKAHQVPVVLKGPPAPPPPGLEHLMKKDPNTKSDTENQSFLRRYWYIILPIVLLTLAGGGK